MSEGLKSVLWQALGYAFLVLGVIGLVLPFLQGFLFIFIGLAILARHAAWAERLQDRLKRRYPRFGDLMDQADAKASGWGRAVAARFRRRP